MCDFPQAALPGARIARGGPTRLPPAGAMTRQGGRRCIDGLNGLDGRLTCAHTLRRNAVHPASAECVGLGVHSHFCPRMAIKHLFPSVALAAAIATPALAGPTVGVSVGVVQPGGWARIDFGPVVAAPVLVYPPPVVILPAASPVPGYRLVPPGHARHWQRHCGRYDACGAPVYVVRDDRSWRGAWPARGHRHDRRDERDDD